MIPRRDEPEYAGSTAHTDSHEGVRDVAITVNAVSKCYHIYDRPIDRLKQFMIPRLCRTIQPLRNLFSSHHMSLPAYYRNFWALKDVSFEIYKGETVGIVGRNGSGKSTLLQIICGTLYPTSGNVHTNGRVAALLELGQGFDPEFTGRENIYMNAAVIGLSKEETDACFDDIVAFADIGDFIEQPVKTYSSGMLMRVAFAVQAMVKPDILIIDEALAVGDEQFQRKCFARLEELKSKGVSILFVSHSGAQIVEICERTILLDSGGLLAVGSPKQVVACYQKLLHAPTARREVIREQIRCGHITRGQQDIPIAARAIQRRLQVDDGAGIQEGFDPALRPCSSIEYESRGARFENVTILDMAGNQVNNLIRGKRYRCAYLVRFTERAHDIRFGMLIKTVSGIELGGALSMGRANPSLVQADPGSAYRVEFSFQCALNPGTYFLNVGTTGKVNGEEVYLHRLVDAAMFRVQVDGPGIATGIIDFSCMPHVEELEESRHA